MINPILITYKLVVILLTGLALLFLFIGYPNPNRFIFYTLKRSLFSSFFTLTKLLSFYIPSPFKHGFGWLWSLLIFDEPREMHTHVLGATKSGKSTYLLQMLYRDIKKGNGVAVIEPHGSLIYHLLHFDILQLNNPSKCYKKIVLADFEHHRPPALNLFSIALPQTPAAREMRIDSLVQNYLEAFDKGFNEPMTSGSREALQNILTVIFELPEPNGFDLLDILAPQDQLKARYQRLFARLKHPTLKRYFTDQFFHWNTEASKAALRWRLHGLFKIRQIRLSLTQPNNEIDIREIMKEGKILLLKANKSKVGSGTSRFLGTLFHQLILNEAYQRIFYTGKKPFFLYIDECQNYISKDISEGLSEARKGGLHYMLAHQRLGQEMSEDQQKAMLSCNVKIYGRLEYEDAVKVSKQLRMKGKEDQFIDLRTGEFFVKVGRWWTRFIKFPTTFALKTEKMGKVRHSYFATSKQFKDLLKWLHSSAQLPPTTNLEETQSRHQTINTLEYDITP